jgi:NitT/TauT family transport system permease protein
VSTALSNPEPTTPEFEPTGHAAATASRRGRRQRRRGMPGLHSLVSVASLLVALAAWQLASMYLVSSFILPSPVQVARGADQLIRGGQLQKDAEISLLRILSGWALGSLIGAPLGFIVGTSRLAKAIVDPFVHFFRFIPALALVSVFMVWLGVGETAKVALIIYATSFLVTVTTATGVAAIPDDKKFAAQCLGARRLFLLFRVQVPAAIPHVYTAMRLALANAFLVIIAVEIIAANSGLGYLIWNARVYFQTSWMFTGVVAIGLLGLLCDRIWRLIGRTLLRRYVGTTSRY